MSYQNAAFFWCGVLEPHGCVLLSEDVSFDYKANKIARDDTLRSSTRARTVKLRRAFWLCRTFARRQSESPLTRSKHVPGGLASSRETDSERKKPITIVRVGPIHLQIACWAPRDARDYDAALKAPGGASRVTPPVQIVGCPPARPCRPEGVAPKPGLGLPERPRTTPKAESGPPS